MKLTDALSLFEARISKAETGLTTMTADDLVKYVGEQIALAETEGDAGKERMAAVKAVIETAKAAEATGATSFEVKPFVAVVAEKAEPEAETPAADPVLDALTGLATQVKALKDSLTPAPGNVETPAGDKEAGEVTEVGKSQGDAPADPPATVTVKVSWPTDLNKR